jgi:hypothetical protein
MIAFLASKDSMTTRSGHEHHSGRLYSVPVQKNLQALTPLLLIHQRHAKTVEVLITDKRNNKSIKPSETRTTHNEPGFRRRLGGDRVHFRRRKPMPPDYNAGQ